ncbi:Protein kinase domain-containing protein [Heracleum sosnowskyi]|uniref:Protein kinase domain-containing protein n=1 Tax=Heracleum sosnowskyi TaxID=360622 RepID=A0AAD8I203_9APIA|nr:Protein kinase domain-containing protein [Heracleum sosnowskyi]
MVGREQIRPLAPASDRHASDNHTETADHLKKKPLKTKTWFRVCMFIAAFFLIIAIVIVIFMFTLFKIKNPTINLNRISVNQLDLNNVTAILTSQNISLTAQVSVKNPNYATFKYPNTNTNLYYRGTLIGEARGAPGQAKARRTVFINETVDLIIGKLEGLEMEKKPRGPPLGIHLHLFSSSMSSSMAIIAVLFCVFMVVPSVSSVGAPAKSDSFTPPDSYLLDCGSSQQTTLSDKRVFLSDQNSHEYLNYEGKDLVVSVPKADVPLPIYLSAKVFSSEATYTFTMNKAGWHWIRLHFFPVSGNGANLQQSKFSVFSDSLVLLHEFSLGNESGWVMKEYLVNATNQKMSIKFTPAKDSTAFINAIEVVSAPDMLISDVGNSLVPVAQTSGLSQNSYQTVYRLNVGGPQVESQSDTLGRTWAEDRQYLKPENAGRNVSVEPKVIIYPDGNSPLIAPPSVYASAMEMGDANTVGPNFNVTWSLDIDASYSYLVRLHFADIVSKSLNDLYFNVYVGGKKAISGLDLSTVAGDLASAYYKDFIVNSAMGLSSPLKVQISPMNEAAGTKNALLNGLEVLKINNSVNSLDGEFGADGKTASTSRGSVAAVGFCMMFGAFVGLGAVAVKWQKRPQDWQKSKSFSSWLLPLHAGDASFMSSKNSLGSRKSAFYSSTTGLGRYFSFAELQEATKNWDASAIIGVGGFGNVYIGEIDNGTKVAIKRGNPQSEQEWAMQWKRKGLLEKIIDPTLVGNINPESMKKFAEAAEKCLGEYGVDRPTMGDVLWNLEYALQLQEASLQGKSEDENNSVASAASPAPATAIIPENRPVPTPEQTPKPTEVQVIDEHSGTAMFKQFAELNGR